MKTILAACLTMLSLLFAAPALADTDSIASWGNDTLGGSIGTTGGSTSLGGVTTTVDGIGTFNGSLSVVGNGFSSAVKQSYTTSGIETNWVGSTPTSTFTADGRIELYGTQPDIGAEFTGPGVSIICDPICRSAD